MAADFSFLHRELLGWIYSTATNVQLGASLDDFNTTHGLTREDSFFLVRYAEAQGTCVDRSNFGGAAASLSPYGIQVVEESRRLASDPVVRARSARQQLLLWIWRCRHSGVEDAVLSSFEAAPSADPSVIRDLTEHELDRAAQHLHGKQLIQRQERLGGEVHMSITSEGEDCVENFSGDPVAYERRSAGTVINIGNNSGNVAANSRDVTMTVTSTIGDIELAKVVLWARSLRQAAPELGFATGDLEEFTQLADRLEQEASGETPDPNRLQRWGRSVLELLNSPVVSGALGGVLSAYGGVALPGLAG